MKRTFKKSQKMLKSVEQRIPLAAQTFSKCYLQYVRGGAPLFLKRGKGAYVWDVDGNRYIDYINGLLPIILGYQYPAVDRAIVRQLKSGITFSLPSPLEDVLAKLLIKHIPCAEMVRFGKNGSDVTSGAVRLARAVTGRDHVATCGYHGWHDWYIGSTVRNLGVPVSTQKMTHRFAYNNLASLKEIFKKHPGQIACVIMEPENYVTPAPGFLKAVRDLAHKNGALLVFDEVITGFRWGLGGAQKRYGVTPDLAAFGKSMANGMPISALVGKRKYMKRVTDIFYSFTNGGEALSIAAAIATIHEMERKHVIGTIWKRGKELRARVRTLIARNGLSDIIAINGQPCWHVFGIKPANGFTDLEIKSFLQQELIQRGILWYGQHNMSFSHGKKEIDATVRAFAAVLPRLKRALDQRTLRRELVGKPITNIFKVR